jgi:hypothetical protein
VSVFRDKNGISKNKGKNFLDEVDGVSYVKYLMRRTRTFVVEHGWEISILSHVRIELMCHLA